MQKGEKLGMIWINMVTANCCSPISCSSTKEVGTQDESGSEQRQAANTSTIS